MKASPTSTRTLAFIFLGQWNDATYANEFSRDAAYPIHVDSRIDGNETRLIADDGAADDLFGCSVSVAGDIALVGAPGMGAAYVFGEYKFSGLLGTDYKGDNICDPAVYDTATGHWYIRRIDDTHAAAIAFGLNWGTSRHNPVGASKSYAGHDERCRSWTGPTMSMSDPATR
jgi:hypothetical protein